MASLFSKPPKAPSLPPVPPPAPIPVVGPDTQDFAMKAAQKRSGFEKTIVAGDLAPSTGKKKLLGG